MTLEISRILHGKLAGTLTEFFDVEKLRRCFTTKIFLLFSFISCNSALLIESPSALFRMFFITLDLRRVETHANDNGLAENRTTIGTPFSLLLNPKPFGWNKIGESRPISFETLVRVEIVMSIGKIPRSGCIFFTISLSCSRFNFGGCCTTDCWILCIDFTSVAK